MLTSKFISHILELLLEGDEDVMNAKSQIQFIANIDYQYTRSGVFITFENRPGIEKYRCYKNNLVLDDVEIKSPQLEIGANCILFFKNGLIDYLEIHSFGGDYSDTELSTYELTQVWVSSPKRIIKSD